MSASNFIAYLEGFRAGLDASGTERCEYKLYTAERCAWIEGLDDGSIERLRHEDALRMPKPRPMTAKASSLRPKPRRARHGERYIDMRLKQIAEETRF